MAIITHRGNPVHTIGELPVKNAPALDFELVTENLTTATLADFSGHNLVLNIFPSIDTPTCAQSVRVFNQQAASVPNTKVINISRDLPFAQKRFCAAEGIENVINLSDFKTGRFGKDYGIELLDGKMAGLHARAVVVVDKSGQVVHAELVPDISSEPDYQAALNAIR
jgi:thioredoxin-dependent peroxiredoxin